MVFFRLIPRLINPSKSTLFKSSNFATTAVEPSENAVHLSLFRTNEQNPTKHTIDHVARYYRVEPDVQKNLFSLGAIPPPLRRNMESFDECCFMVRPYAVELINYLNKTDFSKPVIRYMLYGPQGVGKSVTMAHLLHYAYVKKMLILNVFWANNWTRNVREAEPSVTNPDLMDSPKDSALWLKLFLSQNNPLLQQLDLKASQTYTWSKREITEKGESLISIAEHGISRAKHATDCVAVILKEIKEQCQNGRFRLFVCIDGVNAFFAETIVTKGEDKACLEADALVLVKSFKKFLNNDWFNGAVVVSVDENAGPLTNKPFHTPLKLLGPKGFEMLEPFVPIRVEKYSRTEILSCLDYYIDRDWLQNKRARTESGKEELIFLSGSNPRSLMETCDYR